MSAFDAEVNSKAALNLERTGWQLNQSVSSFREWSKAMGPFGGQVVRHWLGHVARALKVQSESCSAAILAWNAAFEGGKLLDTVAGKMLGGRLSAIIGAHNDLHGLMSMLGTVAAHLGVAPRMQDNPEAIESVRVAFDIMSKASQGSVAVLAVDIILQFQRDATGAAAAKQFLSKYRRQDYEALPSVLWSELGAIASHATALAGPVATEPKCSPTKSSASTTAPSPASAKKVSSSAASVQHAAPSCGASSGSQVGASPASCKKRSAPSVVFSSAKKSKGA